MKKFIIFSLIAVMVTGTVFAADGIFFNAWGRGAFAPLIVKSDRQVEGKAEKDTGGSYAGIGYTWGGNGTRVDFRINGATDFVGFTIASTGEGNGGFGQQDNGAHIWAKPFESDILKLTLGTFIDDTLRGKIGSVNAGFECFTLVHTGNYEEDPIFSRFGVQHFTDKSNYQKNYGFMLSSAPVDGLFIGLMAQTNSPVGSGASDYAINVYRNLQVGVGYEIADTAHIRAQYIGGFLGSYDTTSKDYQDRLAKKHGDQVDRNSPARIEAAFALTAVQNLLVDLGFKFWMPITIKEVATETKYSNGMEVHLGANFRSAAFSLAFRADAESLGAYSSGRPTSGGNDKAANPLIIDVRLVPAYDVNTVCIGLDLGMKTTGAAKAANGDTDESTKETLIGFGAFAKKGLPGGYVKAGLTYSLAPFTGKDGKANGQGVFMIPVVLEYAFF